MLVSNLYFNRFRIFLKIIRTREKLLFNFFLIHRSIANVSKYHSYREKRKESYSSKSRMPTPRLWLFLEKEGDNTSWSDSCPGSRSGTCNACRVESRLRSCGPRVSQQLNRINPDVPRRNFADKQIRSGNPTNGRYTRINVSNDAR